ncbi:DUF4942 domain-containing protein [Serratia sp. PF2-63]|uniref:DUF4942 domain-containing protein n=1 Tax=unclassified Serratia (in: enterobacteria) TaxID=2647522 RepID=UPI0024B5EF19|nr:MULTISPECIES: DUF4942 domain-containing protein [unclassified Serratia (in: enterobacteria)]MDI9266065.1 DUF4942 domain-containing protein [Serratia sp. PF2-63]MDI9266408.1 DUF4942 domain-containing protein [Serratia sp. PF-27]
MSTTTENGASTIDTIGINDNMGGDVIPSAAIDVIIAQRNLGLIELKAAAEKLHAALSILREAGSYSYQLDEYTIIEKLKSRAGLNDFNRTAQINVDRSIWTRLMNETGMFTLMSQKQRDKWNESLYSDKCPAVTLDNVLATFEALNATKAETFEQGLIDVFQRLSWDYKTNNPCRLGKKIIIERLVSRFYRESFRVEDRTIQAVDDLAKIFFILDGQRVPDVRVGEGDRFTNFFNRGEGIGVTCELTYFTVRAYAKGTGHIEFNRLDLVEQINDILAKRFPNTLPARV